MFNKNIEQIGIIKDLDEGMPEETQSLNMVTMAFKAPSQLRMCYKFLAQQKNTSI